MNLTELNQISRKRRLMEFSFKSMSAVFTFFCIFFLAFLLYHVWIEGRDYLNWNFLNQLPSRFPGKAGIKTALLGSLWVIGFMILFSVPLGIMSAIYLEEFSQKNKFTHLIELNINNLAGIPSIIYGMFGLGLFVRTLSLDRSILAGSLTLSLLVLPIIIVASREAIRAVPNTIREAAYALGATQLQVIAYHVLPYSLPNMLTGIILAISRAIGETAPLIMMGALAYVAFVPESPLDEFTVLPIQIFNWVSRPQEEFHHLAAAGILVLLFALLSLNAVAIFLRAKFQKGKK